MILYYTGEGGGVWRGAKLYYIIIEWPPIWKRFLMKTPYTEKKEKKCGSTGSIRSTKV